MPRKSRKDCLGKFFHIMVQGINKEYIFEKEIYKKKYLELLNKSEDYNIEIAAYCIMDNHAHVLIYTEEIKNMVDFMKIVDLLFAMYYNYLEERVGIVFRNRYKSEEIKDRRHLINCIRYIHFNPVNAKMVQNINQYTYSSYTKYKNGTIKKEILELLFGVQDDYNAIIDQIHHRKCSYGKFIDCKEDKENFINYILQEFQNENDINMIEYINNHKVLEKLIKHVRNNSNATMADIADKIGVSRTTIANYLHKIQK